MKVSFGSIKLWLSTWLDRLQFYFRMNHANINFCAWVNGDGHLMGMLEDEFQKPVEGNVPFKMENELKFSTTAVWTFLNLRLFAITILPLDFSIVD